MLLVRRLLTVACCAFVVTSGAADAATHATLLRLFFADGRSVVSFGEYARLGERVLFSMPIGGTPDQPQLHVVTLPATLIDWPRTERYAASARARWYADVRGDADFQQMSSDVALVLNQIALSTDTREALAVAERARRQLAEWPSTHFGYRQNDVLEITGLLDESISALRARAGASPFELALVASPAPIVLEPVLGLPPAREQFESLRLVASLVDRTSDKVTLLKAAIAMIDAGADWMSKDEARSFRDALLAQVRDEVDTDARYARLAQRLMSTASRAAARARVDAVEDVLTRLPKEDARLGHRRPDVVEALRLSVEAQLEAARRFRLMRDRWALRQALYREYERSAGPQLRQLAKAESALESIRQLNGPAPDVLSDLQRRFTGGGDRLQRIGAGVPDDLKGPHDLLVSAWRFAETAVNTRLNAVTSADVSTAWEASSAAAAAILLFDRAQQEIATFVEPPQFP